MSEAPILAALSPVIVLLFLGIVTAIVSRAVGLSPIVGYLALGLGLRASNLPATFDVGTISVLAQLGVVFLLFDVGLHFSLKYVRERAKDIFAFGPIQILFATLVLACVALVLGIPLASALLTGAVLSMSSTAVAARLIAERHQRNCPVGLTATAILVFQDIAAILLLVLVGSVQDSTGIALLTAIAVGKAAAAFAITVVIARLVIRPLLAVIASSRNEEVFTASALVIALAAGWATGQIGLSLTLGAFLGGMTLAETPYRAVIQSEITPFRALLLGFFFIYAGFSLDIATVGHYWYAVIGVAVLLVAVKIVTNAAASMVFKWSVPGSMQLGFLLSGGSEFAFVILSLPAVRLMIGDARCSVLIAAVALSMAATPNLADFGRSLAGSIRSRRARLADPELTPSATTAPAIIVGMGPVGRVVADALTEFEIGYLGVEPDPLRLRLAIADGYQVIFGDNADVRLFQSVDLGSRKISILTEPRLEVIGGNHPFVSATYPNLLRLVAVNDETEAEGFRKLGLRTFVTQAELRGVEIAAAVLLELGCEPARVLQWQQKMGEHAVLRPDVAPSAVPA